MQAHSKEVAILAQPCTFQNGCRNVCSKQCSMLFLWQSSRHNGDSLLKNFVDTWCICIILSTQVMPSGTQCVGPEWCSLNQLQLPEMLQSEQDHSLHAQHASLRYKHSFQILSQRKATPPGSCCRGKIGQFWSLCGCRFPFPSQTCNWRLSENRICKFDI